MQSESVQSVTDDWIIGFFEGEGCFSSSKRGNKTYPKVMIVNTEKELLDAIQAHLNLGHIYPHSHGTGNRRKAWQLNFSSIIECEKLVTLFDGKLHSEQKKAQFKKFKELVITGEHRGHFSFLYYCRHCRSFLPPTEIVNRNNRVFCRFCNRQARKLGKRKRKKAEDSTRVEEIFL